MTRQQRAGWLFSAPMLACIALFFIGPAVAALGLSLTDFDIYALGDGRNLRFIGLRGFADLLSRPLFWRAFGNTVLLAAVGAPLAMLASLGAALLLHSATVRWKPVWRVALFAPYVTSLVASAVVWRYLFNTRHGLINTGLQAIGLPAIDWLNDPRSSLPAILIFVVWKVFGYNMVVFTAALAAVPGELMEAARLDGAGPWTRFRHVTLPAIGPVLLLSALLSASNFLQLFDEPYVMTQGGPAQSTLTVVYFMFEEGFGYWNLGAASAVAVVLLLCILAVTGVQVWLGRRRAWV